MPLTRDLITFDFLHRPPVVAKCDRKRILSSWAPLCGNIVPVEFQVEFSKVRHLTPRQFVKKLSKDLRVSGVVAGICFLLFHLFFLLLLLHLHLRSRASVLIPCDGR